MSNQANEVAFADRELELHLEGNAHFKCMQQQKKVEFFIGISNSGNQKIMNKLDPKSWFVKTQQPWSHSRANGSETTAEASAALPQARSSGSCGSGSRIAEPLAEIKEREKDTQIQNQTKTQCGFWTM